MAGVTRCGIKVNEDGKPSEDGSPCVLKKDHEPPHKPRTELKVSDDDLKLMTATIGVVTAPEELTRVKRTRVVEESPLFKLAAQVVQAGHDAWERGGKKKLWEDTPAIAMDCKAELENKLRGEVHRACAAKNWKATFGDTAILTTPKLKDGKPVPLIVKGKPVMKDGQPVFETEPTGIVKLYFNVRDLPPKKEVKTEATPEAKSDAKPDVKPDDVKNDKSKVPA